jgi:glucose/arabinose dehydrogenase
MADSDTPWAGDERRGLLPNQILMRRIAVIAAALAALSLAGSASAALKLVPVAGGFTRPTYATGAPGTTDLFVVTQAGYVTRIRNGQKHTFLSIADRVRVSGAEEGLLSIAFHPRYKMNRKFYVYYVNNPSNLRIVQYRANARGTRALESTANLRIAIHHPGASNHNGGQLQFGENGILYASVGDGANGDNARNLGTRLGKLLRLNVDDPDAKARIAASGFRNPWRFSVDPKTGRFFVADVGENTYEEIDVFRPGADGLENYGWNRFEGNHQVSSNPLGPGRYVRPIHEYTHGATGGCSVTGGFMVRGGVPGSGRYFYGDYCTGDVWSFRYAGGQKSGFRREAFTVPGNLSSFGTNANGRLLVVSHSGTIYRVAQR